MPLQGHCNCNAVKITVEDQPSGDPHETMVCHCITCKRQSGGSGTYVIAADEALVEIEDSEGASKKWKDTLTDSGTPAERTFCGECGCPLYTTTPLAPGKIVVKMGLFDSCPPASIEIYTKNKEKWEPEYEGIKTTRAAPGV